MTNRKQSIRSINGYPSHLVVLQDGFRVPANGLAEAQEIAARYEARGICATVRIN